MQFDYKTYYFNQIESIPEQSGLYAWYYQINLSDRDIEKCVEGVKATTDDKKKIQMVSFFLYEKIYKYYSETPYKVNIEGALKPKYAGTIDYIPNISESTVKEIVENPELLYLLKQALVDSIPDFSSPIYIGVATNLRTRLLQHKKLIEKYLNMSFFETAASTLPGSELSRDHSFAKDVSIVRKFNVANLIVCVRPYKDGKKNLSCVENIFNRIYCPLCGRN